VAIRLDRAAAILAGSTTYGDIKIPLTDAELLELSVPERALIAERVVNDVADLTSLSIIGKDGSKSHTNAPYPVLITADLAAVRTVLATLQNVTAERREAEAAQQADRQKRWAEAQRDWLAQPDTALVERPHTYEMIWQARGPDGLFITSDGPYQPSAWRGGGGFGGLPATAEVIARAARLYQLAQQRTAESQAHRQRQLEAAQAAEEAASLREAEALHQALQTSGSDGQRKRAERGLLPRDELLTLYRDQLFAPLESFARFERIKRAEVVEADPDRGEYAEAGDYQFDANDATDATDDEFATLSAIETVVKERLPAGAVCTLRLHSAGFTAADDWAVQRKSVLVSLDAPVKVSREYACP
jgi:hypothetical protein